MQLNEEQQEKDNEVDYQNVYNSNLFRKLTTQQIRKILNPYKQNAKEVLQELSNQIDTLEEGLKKYQNENTMIPPSKQQILDILQQNTAFTPTESIQSLLSEKTKLKTSYLHVDNLYINQDEHIPQTKFEIMQMALSNKTIQKQQRKAIKSDDLSKKRKIILQIQQRINQDEIIRKKKEEEERLRLLEKQAREVDVGQLTLNMISDLRKKYFNELVSTDTEEKFKRIKEIKEVYVPQQLNKVKEGYQKQQQEKLKHDLVSKKSQFNSYYQLLALERTMKRVVALKLKPEIKSYSRFKGAEIPKNYSSINSIVKGIIHTSKNSENKGFY
ncbi:unnamed protein product [Paramecium pentaurelia]|uniref:Uncharacterized protein n=1 Tax=Paramecium pentaurelia TaxID=43138 RepID=A0A8S1VF91_9CILI|nr:unnamed protein product [Paramecium pentaurelia]